MPTAQPALWAIQQDHRNSNAARLHQACGATGLPALLFDAADDQVPTALAAERQRPVIFYGSCHFILQVQRQGGWWPGAWFDADVFRYSRYLQHYGPLMFNADARLATLARLAADPGSLPERCFLRGDDDLKTLAGATWQRRQLLEFIAGLDPASDLLQLPVAVAPRRVIEREWRLFMVDGAVATGCQYRRLGDLECLPGVPAEVADFAAALALRWSPAPVYTMDVAASGSGLGVLELNGFNSSGFYAADLGALLVAVQAHVTRARPAWPLD